MSDPEPAIAEARALLQVAERVLVLTGAGISADSGVPTFRGPGGLWKESRAEELATPEAFARDPRLVWEWYGWRRELVSRCRPNAAHEALARWQLRSGGVSIATQNVDGLHATARRRLTDGNPALASTRPRAVRLLEIHGTLFGVRCTGCVFRATGRDPVDASSAATLPRCPECGALLRPDVVWFGEPLDVEVLRTAFAWAEAADVCLVIGTSGVVQPAASLATVTRDSGGRIVEVNPERTPLTTLAACSLRSGAADAVPALLAGGVGTD